MEHQATSLASLPAAPLRPFISHYWLSRNNTSPTHTVLPDGAVDLVVVTGGSGRQRADMFGTSRCRTQLLLELGVEYLGIRFRPGQSRHFLDATAAELTNLAVPAHGQLVNDILVASECIDGDSIFAHLDRILSTHLTHCSPQQSKLDSLIRQLSSFQALSCKEEHAASPHSVARLAATYGKSRRQFERDFIEIVGLSPKHFAQVIRVQRATRLLTHSQLSLADIAFDLGYVDQSHFTHEFVGFHGLPPSKARADVAFLQDTNQPADHNKHSILT
ncbi:AraC family transcriptional regulator [Aliidiomarina soli]|nr:AraC family transcriptional regulator [Aliidiomarina soli]